MTRIQTDIQQSDQLILLEQFDTTIVQLFIVHCKSKSLISLQIQLIVRKEFVGKV